MAIGMQDVIKSLRSLLAKGAGEILAADQVALSHKLSMDKWSKKEILGHLIDSAINNLRRFTEIQFEEKPYFIVPYNQDELVKVNDYQNASTPELLELWTSLNSRIASIIDAQSQETLAFEVSFVDGTTADLRFLMTDYVKHMAHHLNQIAGPE